MAGGVLKLHPKIVVGNGAMNAFKKYRGKIASVIMSYVKNMENDLKNARPERVFITHSGCDRETVEAVWFPAIAVWLTVRKVFPAAKLINDRFHVQQLMSEAVDQLRIRYRWKVY